MAIVDEATLARAAAAGDGQAFARLYDEYEGRIYNFCLRLVGGPEDAADATQDAFLKVLQRLPRLPADRELNFGAYLFTAARNASYDVIGKRKKADPVDLIPESGARPLDGDERGRMELDPERAAMLGALQRQVQAANERLPERQREVLALREVEELSYDEIAAIMDMNRNSVAQLISRARIRLRDELQGTALASIATSSADCERALPLISLRQDRQLNRGEDRGWLEGHIAACATCKVSVEAMHEAGMSYRAWAPVLPAVWLWKATAAQAADLTGSDWTALLDRQRELHAGSPGASAAPGGPAATGGSGVAAGAGAGAAVAPAGAAGVAATRSAGYRRDRRRRAGALMGSMLLVIVALLLFLGRQEVPVELEAGTVDPALLSTATSPAAPASTPMPPVVAAAEPKAEPKPKPARRRAPRAVAPASAPPVVVPAPVIAPVPAPVVVTPAPAPAPGPKPAPRPRPRPVVTSTTAVPTGTGLGSAGAEPAGTLPPPASTPPEGIPAPAPAPEPTTTPAPAPDPAGVSYCDQNPTDPKCRPCQPGATCRRSDPGLPGPAAVAAAATSAPVRRSGVAGA